MKTQIIFRAILIAVALFVSISNNNGSFKQTVRLYGYNQKTITTIPNTKEENKIQSHNNNAANDNSLPFLPQTSNHHEFDCYDFKHHEVRSFWRVIANKIFAVFYHVIILSPIVIETLKQLFP